MAMPTLNHSVKARTCFKLCMTPSRYSACITALLPAQLLTVHAGLESLNKVLIALAQEAVEKLLQTSEALYGDPEQEIIDKEFFGFTYGNYAKLLTESFSHLRLKSHNTVHPMPGSPSKLASRRRLSAGNMTGRAESQRRLSVPARVASALKLNVASITLSAQSLSFFSRESSKHKLSMQSRAPVSSKHPLPARRPSILTHANAARGPSSLRLNPGTSPRSVASGHSSWTSMNKNSVHPLPDQAPLPLAEPKQPSQLLSANRDTLRSRKSTLECLVPCQGAQTLRQPGLAALCDPRLL